jgi:hypothetical protein
MVRVAAAAFAVAASQPAMAQVSQEQTAYYNYGTKPSYAELKIPVTATVGGRCGFVTAPEANLNVGQIDTAGWSKPVQFEPQCTAMWRIAITSANGGLVTPATGLPAGYGNRAPYDVALNIVTDAGVVEPAPCTAASLQNVAGATCDFKGTASPTQGLLLTRSFQQAPSTITVSAPAYAGPDVLISGTYQDTLTVTVSPAS